MSGKGELRALNRFVNNWKRLSRNKNLRQSLDASNDPETNVSKNFNILASKSLIVEQFLIHI
jgi:hypothetical protein